MRGTISELNFGRILNFLYWLFPILYTVFFKKKPEKAPGLTGFLDRASGGPGLAKARRAGGLYKPGPWPDPSPFC